MASIPIPGGASAAKPAVPKIQAFHTKRVQSYGERPDPAMRTVHVSYSYETEEPHITLEFAASEVTWGKKKASIHLKAMEGGIPWKFSMGALLAAKLHVNSRLKTKQIADMLAELYAIKQKDAAKQCASAIAASSAQLPPPAEVADRKEQAQKIQTGSSIYG